MRLIETPLLKTWAGSKSAESRFPHLVKDLICAVIAPDKLRMPSGDAVWVPGFDGVVTSIERNRFVPTGLSVWELGTNANFRSKTNEDYEKRSKDKEPNVTICAAPSRRSSMRVAHKKGNWRAGTKIGK